MATSLAWYPLFPSSSKSHGYGQRRILSTRHVVRIHAFRRSDFDGFAKRVASGEVWRDVWRNANDGLEQLVYDGRKTAERIDRRFSVSRRFSSVAQSATYRARELDRDLEIGRRWRSLTLDFSRNLPRYGRRLKDFLNSPLGRNFMIIFFLWFAFSGWLFQFLIFATLVLPFAAPLLIGTVSNNFLIEGECPACKRQFRGLKNQVVRCTSCGNIVWQPKGDFFSKGGKSSSTSEPDIIDIEFEEK